MDYELNEDQKAFQTLAHTFAEREIAPHAEHYDGSEESPAPILEKAFDAGLMYVNVPESCGGAGISLLDECIMTEELAWGCAGITMALTISNVPSLGVLLAGTEEQRQKFLGSAIAHRQVSAYALSEPAAGSDVKAMLTTARRIGNEYSISGSKCFISSADVASNLLLFAKTDPELGHKGITAFWVPTDREGVRVGPPEKKMGQTASHVVSISLDQVKATAAEVIGGEGSGFKLAMEVFNRTRPVVAAVGIGIARRAFELASEYANERRTMGKAIIEHEGVGFMLADMDIRITAARHLAYEAAWRADKGQPNGVHAARAKCFAADTCMQVTTDAVQVFGGYGYMKEYPVEKLMRDAKVLQLYEGTSQIQRLIIARSLTTSRQAPSPSESVPAK